MKLVTISETDEAEKHSIELDKYSFWTVPSLLNPLLDFHESYFKVFCISLHLEHQFSRDQASTMVSLNSDFDNTTINDTNILVNTMIARPLWGNILKLWYPGAQQDYNLQLAEEDLSSVIEGQFKNV